MQGGSMSMVNDMGGSFIGGIWSIICNPVLFVIIGVVVVFKVAGKIIGAWRRG